ncbi:hypothetical protein [Variovorax sp. EBFNA2]|uniref:hypothetical protein n=1 Tax=Variovorax sp. EBFNA2 TaxID=3342097 RepID=UPI0029C09F65|nr:hypothetical protein [Variovorax boronicumulans]WPG36277.1 hypothetical protein RZE79_22690 [Variovorax boronicumulans]
MVFKRWQCNGRTFNEPNGVSLQTQQPVGARFAVSGLHPVGHSVFWGALAYTLIGGTFAGTILTLVFLLAISIWFRIKPGNATQSAH